MLVAFCQPLFVFCPICVPKKASLVFNSYSRLLTLIAGWSAEDTFAADDYFFWIPLILPHVGGIAGAIVYHVLVTNFTYILQAALWAKIPKLQIDTDDLTAF